ncbi:lantibiotic dehydratase [Solwaraspora sp. WMMA2059]|uniref:lantibiotic dehydratase n=1 Tax=Solwaraspora sp. WMMA2059 TaxID=3015160 RepID=UPI00248BDC82|nr:lantibiotic dehydratase [Solwaraspora sp. WMMA2059]WBB99570.1 lantibiotic dehydratase [Solwaraspora sp. WMMA2059]
MSIAARAATIGRWSLAPVVLLRQAGFPLAVADGLLDPDCAGYADDVLDQRDTTWRLAQRLKVALRAARAGWRGDLASGVGMLRPFHATDLDRLLRDHPGAVAGAATAYQQAATDLDTAWTAWISRLTAAIDRNRREVIRIAAEPDFQQVLLLSNDARYAEFIAWLERGATGSSGHIRRMTDLLTMYVQRVTTKNETHSHFGPLAVARVIPAATGVSWRAGPLRRVAHLSHWAGERLAETFSGRPGNHELVRPRRRPLAFLDDGSLVRYAFRATTGMPDGWRFEAVSTTPLDEDQRWLWQHCDGTRTIGELRAAWGDRQTHLDDVLDSLVRADLLIDRWEIPIGTADPLRALAGLLPDTDDDARSVASFREQLDRFAAAPAEHRAPLLARLKEDFAAVTGTVPNRAGGAHYADRAIFYEEAYGPVKDLRLGGDMAALIAEELRIVYDLALTGPRIRVHRERRLLGEWMTNRFGAGTNVGLDRFYAAFYVDADALARQCEQVDEEIAAAGRTILATLLEDWRLGDAEAVTDRSRLEQTLAALAVPEPAVCNPDVMIAAPNAAAIGRGEFLAVVGDCHGVREALTHSSFAPLIAAEAPDILDEVVRRYQELLDDDELLVDLSRSHPDKTGAQLTYPCPDLEVYGRSPKGPGEVLHPGQLFLTVRDGRPELRAHGVDRRLRLLAPLAGGPSIRQDPLSPFAFPRHFGGIGLHTDDREHLPRIRCGRVVLHRARWRLPATALRGWSPGVHPASGDAAEFLAARDLRRRRGMPDTGFVKIPGEPKPIFVDWRSPLLVRQVCRLARRTGRPVDFSEMFPARTDLWLDLDGKRYTSELRCALFSRGTGAQLP